LKKHTSLLINIRKKEDGGGNMQGPLHTTKKGAGTSARTLSQHEQRSKENQSKRRRVIPASPTASPTASPSASPSGSKMQGPTLKTNSMPQRQEKYCTQKIENFKSRKSLTALHKEELSQARSSGAISNIKLGKLTEESVKLLMEQTGNPMNVPMFRIIYQLSAAPCAKRLAIADSVKKFLKVHKEDVDKETPEIEHVKNVLLLPHKDYPTQDEIRVPDYVASSPDAVGKFTNGKVFIIVVEASKNTILTRKQKYYHQMQLNMALSGAEVGFLIKRNTAVDAEKSNQVTYESVDYQEGWWDMFVKKASDYHSEYMQWFTADKMDEEAGKRLLGMEFEKKPKKAMKNTASVHRQPAAKQKSKDTAMTREKLAEWGLLTDVS
jgi:hypothetical protein